jgi:hypothetical protein
MTKALALVALLAVVFAAVPAHATNYLCQGTVNFLGMGNDGTVYVSGPGGIPIVQLCNINTAASNSIGTEACKSYYSTLLAVKLSGGQALVYFGDSLTCSTQPAWTIPVSVYFIATT